MLSCGVLSGIVAPLGYMSMLGRAASKDPMLFFGVILGCVVSATLVCGIVALLVRIADSLDALKAAVGQGGRRTRRRNSSRAGLVWWERMRPEPGGSGLIALSSWTSGAIHLFHLLSKIERSRLPHYISKFKDSCQRNGCILRIKNFIYKRSACSHFS